jgi:signal transduction histidine kinase
MFLFATGSAFVDRTGAVVAADAGFLARLGLGGDPTPAFRARVESSPELRGLLAGGGESVARVAGADGAVLELERIPSSAGVLLVVRDPRAEELGEHALRSHAFGRLVAGVAHDIKNPLNAMSLQIALLSEKLSSGGDPSEAVAATAHLAAIRDQIGRVNDVLRRLLDVLDPAAPLGYMDLASFLTDVASLLAHDARRRRVEITIDVHAGGVRTLGDASRVGRIVVGMCSGALARTPEGGRFAARAEARNREAMLVIEHASGDPDGGVGYDIEVLRAGAAAVGGRFERERVEQRTERLTLVVPGYEYK